MNIKKLRENRYYKIFTNGFIIISTIFLVFILFFDENTHLNREFNEEIEALETAIKFYKEEIEKDRKTIELLQDSLQLERFAREKYLMKKKNEDVYIIEFDTITQE